MNGRTLVAAAGLAACLAAAAGAEQAGRGPQLGGSGDAAALILRLAP